jgi:hypothetical protein
LKKYSLLWMDPVGWVLIPTDSYFGDDEKKGE